MITQWVAMALKIYIFWQLNWQIFGWNWNRAAIITINNRNRATPITLPRHTPIAQAIGGFTPTSVDFFERSNSGFNAVFNIKTIPRSRIKQCTGAGIGLCRDVYIGWISAFWQNHWRYWQIIGIGKIKVALVMRRTTKNGASAIFHQHKIRNMDW